MKMNYMEQDTRAAAEFWREVKRYSETAKTWDPNVVWHDIAPDDQRDITLISQKVYGNRNEFLAVMAAIGLNNIDDPVPQKKIALPSAAQLQKIKRKTKYETDYRLRENQKPVWTEW